MKDKLEKFISDNRQQFDEDPPGDEMWGKIAAGIDKPKVLRINIRTILWRAAAVLVIFIASYFFHDLMQRNGIDAKGKFASRETYAIKNSFRTIGEKQIVTSNVAVSNQKTYTPNLTNSANNVAVTEDNELPEVKAFYATQIAEKEKQIYDYSAADPKIKIQIKSEFSQLDSSFNSLRIDSKDNINNREIVEAMIQNYRMRLELLENILQQLQEKDSQAYNRIRHE